VVFYSQTAYRPTPVSLSLSLSRGVINARTLTSPASPNGSTTKVRILTGSISQPHSRQRETDLWSIMLAGLLGVQVPSMVSRPRPPLGDILYRIDKSNPGMTYIRGDAPEIDAWEALGNDGWNWETLFPYYKRVENLTAPTAAQAAVGATFNPEFNGYGGLLNVGFLPELDNTSMFAIARDTWNTLGYPKIEDVNGGRVRGFDVWPMTVDYNADTREDAARAYYWPVVDRPNLTIIRGTVRRLLWANGTDTGCKGNKTRATGVDYLAVSDGRAGQLRSEREVILSAGSLRTPLILELSGVGNPR
jgi:hypothetical protein